MIKLVNVHYKHEKAGKKTLEGKSDMSQVQVECMSRE